MKNNFSILISLMRLSKHSGKTVDPKIIFEEYEQRVFSMLKVHDMLYLSKNFTGVNIGDYLFELVNEFRNTHVESAKNIKADLPSVDMILDSKKALHLGLIVTEIFLNYFKYCFLKSKNCNLMITLSEIKKTKILLRMGNDNEGFDFNEKVKADTLGLPLIKDLAEGICEKVNYPTLKRNYYEFEISSN